MEIAARKDAERILEREKSKRISARQSQVRKQSQNWMNENRQNYDNEKERQIKNLNTKLSNEAKEEAMRDVERMQIINQLEIKSLGTAHIAAANLPDYECIRKEKKIKNELLAKERGSAAFKKHKEIKAEKQEYIRRLQSLKERVRMEEDIKSKELAERRPFRPTPGFGNEVDSNVRKKPYNELLSKDLFTPAAGGKENKRIKKKPISKLDSKKENEKIKLIAERPFPIKHTGSFAKIAKKKEDNIKSPTPNSSKSKSYKRNKNLNRKQKVVTYYDDSLPNPPQFFKQPKGIVQREKKQPENSWTVANKLEKDKKINNLKFNRNETVRKQKAQERGLRAMKLALLENKIKDISNDANDKCLENISIIDKEENQKSTQIIKDEIQANVEKINNDSSDVSFISWDAHDDDEINKPSLPQKNGMEVAQKSFESKDSLSTKKAKLKVNYDKIDGNESDSSTGYLSFEEEDSILIQDQNNDKKAEMSHLDSISEESITTYTDYFQESSLTDNNYPVTSTPQTSISMNSSNDKAKSTSLSSDGGFSPIVSGNNNKNKKSKMKNSLKRYIEILMATEPERIKELGISSSSSSSATKVSIASDTESRLTTFDEIDLTPVKEPKVKKKSDKKKVKKLVEEEGAADVHQKEIKSSKHPPSRRLKTTTTTTVVGTIPKKYENEMSQLSDVSEEREGEFESTLTKDSELTEESKETNSKNSSGSTIAEVKYVIITPNKLNTINCSNSSGSSTLAEMKFNISPTCLQNINDNDQYKSSQENYAKKSASGSSFYYSCVEDERKNKKTKKHKRKKKNNKSTSLSSSSISSLESSKQSEKSSNESLESLKLIGESQLNQGQRNNDKHTYYFECEQNFSSNINSKNSKEQLSSEGEIRRFQTIEDYLNFSIPEFLNYQKVESESESTMISKGLRREWNKLEIERPPWHKKGDS